MGARRFPYPLETLRGELCQDDTRIRSTSLSFDQTVPYQSVDHSRQSAGRDHDPPRQLSHAQTPIGSAGEPDQHVVVAERDAVLGSQLGIEGVGESMVRVQQ